MASERHEPAAVVSLPRRDIASRDMASHDDDRAPIFASRAAVSP
jgi:hypothetical protein